jgi:hypothetical protein
MKILNLHIHNLYYNLLEKEKIPRKFYYSEPQILESNHLYDNFINDNLVLFKCDNCSKFNTDYHSLSSEMYPFSHLEPEISVFALKNYITKFQKKFKTIYELIELDNTILLGTKDEIISYICTKYNEKQNEISKLNSTIKHREEELSKISEKFHKEEINSKNLESELLKLQNQEKKDKGEREQKIKEIEKQIQNLSNNNKNLGNKNKDLELKLENITKENNKNIFLLNNEKQSKKDLELKFSEFQTKEKKNKEEGEKYIKEKEKQIQNLTNNNKDLGNKIKELDSKLDNIIKENSKNISELLSRLKNEEKSKKDLEFKLSELQEQERQKEIKNEELEKCLKNKDEELKKNESFGLKFESDTKSGDYDIILDITSFQDLVSKGWKIKYNKKKEKLNI